MGLISGGAYIRGHISGGVISEGGFYPAGGFFPGAYIRGGLLTYIFWFPGRWAYNLGSLE